MVWLGLIKITMGSFLAETVGQKRVLQELGFRFGLGSYKSAPNDSIYNSCKQAHGWEKFKILMLRI